jgi:hypothetical protein
MILKKLNETWCNLQSKFDFIEFQKNRFLDMLFTVQDEKHVLIKIQDHVVLYNTSQYGLWDWSLSRG